MVCVKNIWMIKMSSTVCHRIVREPLISLGEVHLFCISMEYPEHRIQELSDMLSRNEARKRDRFHFAKDRERYVIRHGTLREIIGHYLGVPACDVDIEHTKYGKPVIMENDADSWLQFNLSSANDVALIAVTHTNPVGVDIEYIVDDFQWQDIALRYFSPGEIEQLFSLPEKSRKRAFFDCWTRKEAYVKARGEGLSDSLDGFEVSLHPEFPAALLNHDGGPHESSRWSLHDVALGSQYAAAFATEGRVSEYKFWDLR